MLQIGGLKLKHVPVLDPGFVPAVLWNQAYQQRVAEHEEACDLVIALERGGGSISTRQLRVFPHEGTYVSLNRVYVERIIKFLLWQKGGWKLTIAGSEPIADMIRGIYQSDGIRSFDFDYMGCRVFGRSFEIHSCALSEVPAESESSNPLGRNLDGCRIGFDLGGSDRKCAAVIDGEVVFSEEIAWDPYFETDPQYHFNGIMDSLKRASEHLPRVDAIGGSSAGVYVNNEVRAASLFRGIPEALFEAHVKRIFFKLREVWGNIPFDVVNDGEVTALAGSMSLNDNAVLGVAMGTSEAAGYVDALGHITTWLNELAFAPIDYREDAPRDEWSGDVGCGVNYFSQQGIGRLAKLAGFKFPEEMGLPEQLVAVQEAMAEGDSRARSIYETTGVQFGYTIAHYADFYEIRNLLILGRVTSGEGGEIIIAKAKEVLRDEFPEWADCINLVTPNEKDKRHGQAVAAASLPSLEL